MTAELDPAQLATLPGRAFSTGDSIRYLAPADSAPGQVTFSYTAVAGSSTPVQPVQTVSTVTITVVAGDPAQNLPPNTPVAVTARVFTKGAISISVPLAGIDPDGDWVVLQSLEQPEAPLGETVVSGADTLSYKAFDKPGVDRIRYLATDPAGLTVTGSVTVLVAEPGDSARPPVAPDLAVAVRPGASIRIDPLSVVTDPGGQQVLLATPAFAAPAELSVEVDDQSLILTAPAQETVASMRYTVVNAKGLIGVRIGEGHRVRRRAGAGPDWPRTSSSGRPTWRRTTGPSTSTFRVRSPTAAVAGTSWRCPSIRCRPGRPAWSRRS